MRQNNRDEHDMVEQYYSPIDGQETEKKKKDRGTGPGQN
jgi:hypothetical protein